MIPARTCPGCGHDRFTARLSVPDQPVVLNYRFASAAEAQKVPRRDVDLAQCARCGLVFSATFDPELIPYDERYENRQCCSPLFTEYLDQMAGDLTARYQLQGKRVLEVGCGKGDFLKLLCQKAGAFGVGYDTTYEGPAQDLDGRVRFSRSYVRAADVTEPFDCVICRHVIEHVGAIGTFLAELRAISEAAGNPVTILETPSFEWIVQRGSFWDVFYEHCNYFSLPCLRYLTQLAGFGVLHHVLTFGDQYQLIHLGRRAANDPAPEPPSLSKAAELQVFAQKAGQIQRELAERLRQAGAERGWAIWGAGAKGVALVNQMSFSAPRFVIDSNPAKTGCVIPGSSVPVISPDDPAIASVPVILAANPNYVAEIRKTLAAGHFHPMLLST